MFGYVIPDKPNMLIKDFEEFRAYYCGLCKTIGKSFGELPRLATNYDCTFLLAFLHGVLDVKPEYARGGCILNPLKKKSFVKADSLESIVADITVLLGYYKAEDDVFDEGGFKKRVARRMLKRAKKRAAKRLPEINDIFKNSYDELRKLEKEGCDSIDIVCDSFASMLQKSVDCVLKDKATKETDALTYNLGKWVYLMDALDDLQKDNDAKRYNPLIACFKNFESKEQFLKDNAEDLEFIVKTTYNAVVDNYNLIEINTAEGVLSNIIYLGMSRQTDAILKGEEKCKIIRL